MLGQITQQQELEEHIHFCTARKTFMSWEKERNRNILVFKMCFWSSKPKLEQHGASHVAVYERWLLLGKVVTFAVYGHQMCYCERVVMWKELVWARGSSRSRGDKLGRVCGGSGRGGRSLLAKVFDSLINISFDNAGWSVTASVYEAALPARGCTHAHTRIHWLCFSGTTQ